MPIARPLSLGSQISAMVPAPTAWTEAAAPPLSIRMMINIAIVLETALRMPKRIKKMNETR